MKSEPKYRGYAIALYQALQEDAFYTTLEKSVGDPVLGREAMLQYLQFSMQEAEKYGLLFEPDGHHHGISIWIKPQSAELEVRMKDEKKQFLLGQMGSASETCYQQIVSQMSQNASGLIADDAWYLSIVGIKPEFQNRGLGPGLVTEVLQQSDRLQLPSYLETFSTRNMSFYERLGYDTVASFFEPTTEAEYWLMARNSPDNQFEKSV
jgi:ribosomal protein S18 acetylase RimI-like enzyme